MEGIDPVVAWRRLTMRQQEQIGAAAIAQVLERAADGPRPLVEVVRSVLPEARGPDGAPVS